MMPLSNLTPLVTSRFQEVNNLLSTIAALESRDPQVSDSEHVRTMRGLFYVHLYGAFEYAMDQAFIRLAQHVSSIRVARKHIHPPLFSVVLDDKFTSLQGMKTPEKKYRKRIETMACERDDDAAAIRDTVLSQSFQSVNAEAIQLAFDVYGLTADSFYDITKKGYLDEVVERRHAVAHGRESPVAVGVRQSSELRVRYDVAYNQAIYVIDVINQFCNKKHFVLQRYRRIYP